MWIADPLLSTERAYQPPMLSSACKLPGIAVGLLALSLVSLLSSWTGLWWSVEHRTVGDSTTHRHVAVAAVDGVNHDAVPSPYVNDNHPHESLTTAEQIEHLKAEIDVLKRNNEEQLRMIERILSNASAMPNLDLNDLVRRRSEEIRLD